MCLCHDVNCADYVHEIQTHIGICCKEEIMCARQRKICVPNFYVSTQKGRVVSSIESEIHTSILKHRNFLWEEAGAAADIIGVPCAAPTMMFHYIVVRK